MTLERISASLLAFMAVLSFAMAFLLSSAPMAEAGFFGTPTGGFGVNAPAPQPTTGGFASSAGASPASGR